MDDSTIEVTKALDFGEENDDSNGEQEPVGYLKVPCQKGFPEKLYPVYQGDNVIGRHDSCKISLPMKGLSEEHACIEVKGDAHFIYDMGSGNRTQRNTHFLTASVRHDLKDNDRLTFGDVDCLYQVGGQVQGADGDDTRSEARFESMFQTAGPSGEDYHSDGSSDTIRPSQPLAANTQSMIKMGGKANNLSASFIDFLLIPDSDLEDDQASSTLTILAADSPGTREDVKSKLITAPTQVYVSDSDATTDDEEDKRTKSILMAAKQAFTEDDISTCSEDFPRKHSILTEATQAFVGDSDADSPIKTEDGQTPAKKLKTINSKETVVVTPHSSNKRTSLPATETPKTSAKKLSCLSTPKGSPTKELDTSLVNSPTLRKPTTEGIKTRVMFIGMVDNQGEKIVKELGGELVSSVYDCTHLVTDQIRRTVKFLCCLSRGVPIVSPQWLVSSKRSGFFSDPSSFLVLDDASEEKFKLSLRRSLNKANERPLFSGYKIHVTESVKPKPAHMKDMVLCAGAQYVESMPRKASPNMVVISCKKDQSQCGLAMKAGIPVVNAEFVLTGILRQEVDVNAFSLSRGDTGSQGQQSSKPPSKKMKR